MACDIRNLPFDNDSADEILAVHVVEHLYLHELEPTLSEWKRVLKPGGLLVIEVPCLDKVIQHFMSGAPANLTLWALYGDPSTHKSEADLHKMCYSYHMLMSYMNNVGFEKIMAKDAVYHVPARDMRIEATK